MLLQALMFVLFCCTWLVTFLAVSGRGDTCKDFCVSIILWSACLFVMTEALSAFNLITAPNLLAGWGIVVALEAFVCVKRREAIHERLTAIRKNFRDLLRGDDVVTRIFAWFVVGVMILRTVLAVSVVSYNYDAMSYHLARVMYWVQHCNVAYFDTSVVRQLISPVFAEYINLHVILLTGGDIFVNMAQNFAAWGCLVLMYGTLRKLDCGVRWAMFGCVMVVGMNVFAGEAISTQVDMVGTLYLMSLVYMLVEVLRDRDVLNVRQFVLMGVASGFIYITKSNACIPAAMIIIFVIASRLARRDWKVARLCVVSLVMILAVCAPTFVRNYKFCGDIFVRDYVGEITIGTFAPQYLAVNMLKNLIAFGVERNGQLLQYGAAALSSVMGVNLNDPAISWPNTPFEPQYSVHIDLAGAHLVIPMAVLAMVFCVAYVIKRRDQLSVFMTMSSVQLFVMAAIVRWQPWGGRLLLPSLVVAVIPVTWGLSKVFSLAASNRKSWRYALCCFIVAELFFQNVMSSLEHTACHSYFAMKNLLGRQQRYTLYFGVSSQAEEGRKAHEQFAHIIDEGGYRSIGLYTSPDAYQYPILARYVSDGCRVENVSLREVGSSARSLNPDFAPDVIITEGVELDAARLYECNGKIYQNIYTSGRYGAWIE